MSRCLKSLSCDLIEQQVRQAWLEYATAVDDLCRDQALMELKVLVPTDPVQLRILLVRLQSIRLKMMS